MPAKAAQMAYSMVDMVTSKLIDVGEVFVSLASLHLHLHSHAVFSVAFPYLPQRLPQALAMCLQESLTCPLAPVTKASFQNGSPPGILRLTNRMP